MIKQSIVVAAAAFLLSGGVQAEPIFELRTYTTHEGKLDTLHTRFRDHTMALFEKHGMTNIGYWIPMETPNTLTYLLKHESAEAAKASWQGFGSDPVWQEVAKNSRKDGPIISNIDNVFMTAADYSQIQ
jgi:hypothetical protein